MKIKPDNSGLLTEEYSPDFNMMPFLDILFAAIGIFIIIFSIQDIFSRQESRPRQADILIICRDKGEILWADKNKKIPVTTTWRNVPKMIKDYAYESKTAPAILIALKPEGFQTWEELKRSLDKLTLAKKGQDAKINLTKTLWPLSEGTISEKDMIKKWQDENIL